MPFFVIAGLPDCKYLAQAVYISKYLQERLPNFCVKIIRKKPKLWATLLDYVNKSEKWCHTSSPIIWKELCRSGSKPYLIGGLSEFWEYIDDYYGLQAKIPKDMIDKLVDENIQNYMISQAKLRDMYKHYVTILITGAMNKLILTLIPEILSMSYFTHVHIFLHDNDPDFMGSQFMADVLEDVVNLSNTVTLVESLQECLGKTDLLFIIEDMGIRENEGKDRWIARNVAYMNYLGDIINVYCRRNLRILICQNGPACLNASVLCEECRYAKSKNIVVVSNDLGLAPLNKVCREANIDLADVGGPPVWGFIGFNNFVDLEHAVMKANIYRPYDRAVLSSPNSTLPLGTIHTELRFLSYILEDLEEGEDDDSAQVVIEEPVHQSSCYAKTRAIISVLKNWYSDEPTNEVISLGIKSDGDAFNIPLGMVFSQPCIIEDGKWRPYTDIPVSPEVQEKIDALVQPATEIMEEFNIFGLHVSSIFKINL